MANRDKKMSITFENETQKPRLSTLEVKQTMADTRSGKGGGGGGGGQWPTLGVGREWGLAYL
jgi:hypothetical protein